MLTTLFEPSLLFYHNLAGYRQITTTFQQQCASTKKVG